MKKTVIYILGLTLGLAIGMAIGWQLRTPPKTGAIKFLKSPTIFMDGVSQDDGIIRYPQYRDGTHYPGVIRMCEGGPEWKCLDYKQIFSDGTEVWFS